MTHWEKRRVDDTKFFICCDGKYFCQTDNEKDADAILKLLKRDNGIKNDNK